MLKNIIFDLGGVIINIDYNLTINAFKDLGVTNFDLLYSQAQQTKLFDKFETGKITPADFRKEIKNLLPPKISNYEIDKAWCAMLLNFPHERILLLDQLKKKYRLFLLSNTNAIHIREVTKILKSESHWKTWNSVFERKYYSYKIGLRKPGKEIYELVLKENNLEASETILIDDTETNINGAKKTGIKTYFLKKGEDILNLSF